MIQFLKNIIFEITRLLLPFSSVPNQLMLTRITGKFDVVERVPVYTKIRY